MQMLYNSDAFVVVQIDLPAEEGRQGRGGYEIVDKFARKEIYIEGALAESFKLGAQALAESHSSPDALDDFIAGFAHLAHQPLTLQ